MSMNNARKLSNSGTTFTNGHNSLPSSIKSLTNSITTLVMPIVSLVIADASARVMLIFASVSFHAVKQACPSEGTGNKNTQCYRLTIVLTPVTLRLISNTMYRMVLRNEP